MVPAVAGDDDTLSFSSPASSTTPPLEDFQVSVRLSLSPDSELSLGSLALPNPLVRTNIARGETQFNNRLSHCAKQASPSSFRRVRTADLLRCCRRLLSLYLRRLDPGGRLGLESEAASAREAVEAAVVAGRTVAAREARRSCLGDFFQGIHVWERINYFFAQAQMICRYRNKSILRSRRNF